MRVVCILPLLLNEEGDFRETGYERSYLGRYFFSPPSNRLVENVAFEMLVALQSLNCRLYFTPIFCSRMHI